MKVMIRVSSIFVLLIMAVSCATTPRALPEKYNLDDYLEAVDQISTSRVSGWEEVDNQSFVLRTTFKAIRTDYYLIVLRRPLDVKYSNVALGIENTASKDKELSTQEIVGSRTTARNYPGSDFKQAPSNIAGIAAGYDRMVVSGPAGTDYYVIDKIYKLKGREQIEEIKVWLRNN